MMMHVMHATLATSYPRLVELLLYSLYTLSREKSTRPPGFEPQSG